MWSGVTYRAIFCLRGWADRSRSSHGELCGAAPDASMGGERVTRVVCICILSYPINHVQPHAIVIVVPVVVMVGVVVTSKQGTSRTWGTMHLASWQISQFLLRSRPRPSLPLRHGHGHKDIGKGFLSSATRECSDEAGSDYLTGPNVQHPKFPDNSSFRPIQQTQVVSRSYYPKKKRQNHKPIRPLSYVPRVSVKKCASVLVC